MAAAKGGGLKDLGLLMSLGKPPKANPVTGLGSGAPDGDGADEENAFDQDKQDAPDDMLVGAAHDVMSSLRARDPESFAVAMKSFVSMC